MLKWIKHLLNALGAGFDSHDQHQQVYMFSYLQGVQSGRVEKWTWDIDIEKVKQDLRNDINGAYEAIELLIERKRLLEEKLVELNHPELIKK